jgi:hypothetical protein
MRFNERFSDDELLEIETQRYIQVSSDIEDTGGAYIKRGDDAAIILLHQL